MSASAYASKGTKEKERTRRDETKIQQEQTTSSAVSESTVARSRKPIAPISSAVDIANPRTQTRRLFAPKAGIYNVRTRAVN